jgi:hypothetical protein
VFIGYTLEQFVEALLAYESSLFVSYRLRDCLHIGASLAFFVLSLLLVTQARGQQHSQEVEADKKVLGGVERPLPFELGPLIEEKLHELMASLRARIRQRLFRFRQARILEASNCRQDVGLLDGRSNPIVDNLGCSPDCRRAKEDALVFD